METKDLCADLVLTANALEAVVTVSSDTFTSGSEEDLIRSVAAQPSTFSYLMYVISDYAHTIVEKVEKLESSLNSQ